MPRLKDAYKADVIPALMQKFEYKNIEVNQGMILGCIECYEYQACETDGYFNSAIHWSLVNLKEAMLKRYIKNDGYEIPYGYDGHDMSN